MPQEFLDGANVVAVFEQVRGKGVTERVAGSQFGDPGSADGLVDGPLDDRLVEGMPPALARIHRPSFNEHTIGMSSKKLITGRAGVRPTSRAGHAARRKRIDLGRKRTIEVVG